MGDIRTALWSDYRRCNKDDQLISISIMKLGGGALLEFT